MTRSLARIRLHEWDLGDFEQEMMKRVYGREEFAVKLKRLWKFYGKVLHRPKVIIKEYDTALRRYFRYQAKKKLQVSYLFGKEDPIEQFNSSDQSSSHSSDQEQKEVVAPFNVLDELRKAVNDRHLEAKPAGFNFQTSQMNPNLSHIFRGGKQKPEPEKSIAALESILNKISQDMSIDHPSFLKETSCELSLIINGTERIKKKSSPEPTNRLYLGKGLPFFTENANFKKKNIPKLVKKANGSTRTQEGGGKSKELSKQTLESEFKKVYKISSRNHIPQSTDSNILKKITSSGRSTDRESTNILKRSTDSRLTDKEERRLATAKINGLGSGGNLVVRGKKSETKVITTANILELMKKGNESQTKINPIGLGPITSSISLKPQLLTKLIKKPSEANVHKNSLRQATNGNMGGKRTTSTGQRGSKGGSRKNSKLNSPSKSPINLVAQAVCSFRSRKPEPNTHEAIRSASKNYNKSRTTRSKVADNQTGAYGDSSSYSRLPSNLGQKVYHSKNLSDFNITRGNLTKMQESARQKSRTKTQKVMSNVGRL